MGPGMSWSLLVRLISETKICVQYSFMHCVKSSGKLQRVSAKEIGKC